MPEECLERIVVDCLLEHCPPDVDFLDVIRTALRHSRVETAVNRFGRQLHDIFLAHAKEGGLELSFRVFADCLLPVAVGLTLRRLMAAAALSVAPSASLPTKNGHCLGYNSFLEALVRVSYWCGVEKGIVQPVTRLRKGVQQEGDVLEEELVALVACIGVFFTRLSNAAHLTDVPAISRSSPLG
jgi:hypothetical protein